MENSVRTEDEIIAKVKEWEKKDDFFGFKRGDVIVYLSFDKAKEFLKSDTKPEEWTPPALTRESILKQMEEYMSFAWDKANNCRGLSAGRSMDHYTAWTWLICDDDKFPDLGNYQYYGKDHLVALCNHYGWDSSQWDDGERTNG